MPTRPCFGQRSRGVGQSISLEDLLPWVRSVVAIARQIREEVMFDLVRQVAGHEVHGGAPGDVGRPSIWTQVPLAPGFALDRVLAKVCTPSGKCPHMMTEWVHRLRTRLAVRLAVSVVRADGPEKQWVQHVVAGGVPGDLGEHLYRGGKKSSLVDTTLQILPISRS